MSNLQTPHRIVSLIATAILWSTIALAADSDRHRLHSKFSELNHQLNQNPYDAPMHIESSEEGDWLKGEVYGVIDHPFETAGEALSTPAGWCDILFLHPNVKACVVEGEQLRVYMGRKYYQPPGDAYLTSTRLHPPRHGDDYLVITAEAGEGPFGLEGYTITLEAMPIEQARTFVHFAYAVRYTTLTEVALGAYFATLGLGKVGFTRDENGQLVHGTRGMIERNAMRNYLAITAYLDTLALPEAQRRAARVKAWFDASERYPRQLHKLEWAEYREQKAREFNDQQQLERHIPDTTLAPH